MYTCRRKMIFITYMYTVNTPVILCKGLVYSLCLTFFSIKIKKIPYCNSLHQYPLFGFVILHTSHHQHISTRQRQSLLQNRCPASIISLICRVGEAVEDKLTATQPTEIVKINGESALENPMTATQRLGGIY